VTSALTRICSVIGIGRSLFIVLVEQAGRHSTIVVNLYPFPRFRLWNRGGSCGVFGAPRGLHSLRVDAMTLAEQRPAQVKETLAALDRLVPADEPSGTIN